MNHLPPVSVLRGVARLLVLGVACGVAALAQAQGRYPERTVKVVVALPAGGSVDAVARLLSQKLADDLGQPFVVDNKAGASGQIGMPQVARAAPDGYTLAVSPASFLTTNKSIFKSLPTTRRPTSRPSPSWSTSRWCWWCATRAAWVR